MCIYMCVCGRLTIFGGSVNEFSDGCQDGRRHGVLLPLVLSMEVLFYFRYVCVHCMYIFKCTKSDDDVQQVYTYTHTHTHTHTHVHTVQSKRVLRGTVLTSMVYIILAINN